MCNAKPGNHLKGRVSFLFHISTHNGHITATIYIWPQLFKRWIALSTEKIAIHWISYSETNCNIQWIVIYPVDSVIHLLNNWGLMVNSIHICVDFTKHCGHRTSRRMTQSKNCKLNLVSLQDAENIHCYHFRIQSFYSSLCFALILWLKV